MNKNEFRTHTCGELSKKQIGESVILSGWIQKKRDHGSLLFVDLRDHYGITQCVVDLTNETLSGIEKIHPESVITIYGKVVERSAETKNPKLATGDIEVVVDSYKVLSEAEILPFQVVGDDSAPEDLRLKYRFVDLRRERMQKNMETRSAFIRAIREKMWSLGFMEFQTPILTASSPEGARDYLVPSRLNHGEFYALPQAPQVFKQLIMVSGFDKYFQVAPCFRDEDLRADRLIEFYQLDMEMSFVTQDDVLATCERIVPVLMQEFCPDKKVSPDIPRIPYRESMDKYGSDKPDLRNPIILKNVTEVFAGSGFSIFANAIAEGAIVKAIPAPKTADKPRSWFDKMGEFAKEQGLKGLGYIQFGEEVKGPIAKVLTESEIAKIREITGVEKGDSVFFVCEKKDVAEKASGKIRIKLGEDLELINQNELKFCWIVDFPFFEKDEETDAILFSHNPFSMPQGGMDALMNKNPTDILAFQYDMVLNGNEILSGGVRNYNPDILLKAFEITGYGEDEIKRKFAGTYNAFHYGAPPHAGCAFGIDRLVWIITGAENLRECVLFPTNQKGQDLMLGAPSEVTEQQLRDVHISIRKKM